MCDGVHPCFMDAHRLRHSPAQVSFSRWLEWPLVALIFASVLAWLIIFVRPAGSQTSAKSQHRPSILICIDPGHPSDTSPGRRVQHGVTELNINWQIALKLESLLEKHYRIKTMKTREVRDQVMSNEERAVVANRERATLVLRLHCDSGPNHGFTLYYPDRRGTHEDRMGPEPAVINASRRAAYVVHKGMREVLAGTLKDRGVRGESGTYVGSRHGALTASIFSKVPAVTVEMVFLSNKADARFIKRKAGQEKMARALANGVMAYLRTSYRPDLSAPVIQDRLTRKAKVGAR